MLKNKLSHIAILEEQVEKLQEAANQISGVTGHGIEEVEEFIVRLLSPLAMDFAKPGEDKTIKSYWKDGKLVAIREIKPNY